MMVTRKRSARYFRVIIAGFMTVFMLAGCGAASSSDTNTQTDEAVQQEDVELSKELTEQVSDSEDEENDAATGAEEPATEEALIDPDNAGEMPEENGSVPEDYEYEQQPFGADEAMSEEAYDDLMYYLEEVIEMGQIPFYEGLDLMADGSWEEVFGSPCAYFRLGTNHPDHFVTEHHVYVAQHGAIFEYDVVTDTFIGMDIPGKIFCDGWGPGTYAAVITDPYSEEAMWYYAAQPEEGHMAIVAMQDGVTIRLEQVHVDWDTYQVVADETVLQEKNMPCGAVVYWNIPMAETIPEYRIVAEYEGSEAVWDAIYDGENGDTIRYMHVTDD